MFIKIQRNSMLMRRWMWWGGISGGCHKYGMLSKLLFRKGYPSLRCPLTTCENLLANGPFHHSGLFAKLILYVAHISTKVHSEYATLQSPPLPPSTTHPPTPGALHPNRFSTAHLVSPGVLMTYLTRTHDFKP